MTKTIRRTKASFLFPDPEALLIAIKQGTANKNQIIISNILNERTY